MHLVSTISLDDLDDDDIGERHTAHTLQSPQHLDLEESGVTTVKDGLFFRFVEYDGVTVTTSLSLCFLEGVLRTAEASLLFITSLVSETCRVSEVSEVSEVRERTGGGMLVIESVESCDCDIFVAIFAADRKRAVAVLPGKTPVEKVKVLPN